MRHVTLFAFLLCLTLGLTACLEEKNSLKTGAAEQETNMQRANSAIPTPQVNNFLTRESVAKWMRRMDAPNKIFYVYIMADTGNPVGYYTAQNRPVSSCALLTPPDRVVDRYEGDVVMSAPALDGVYYGNSQCAGVFFFDAATDAYIEISGFHYFVTDQPLQLEAKPIQVESSEQS